MKLTNVLVAEIKTVAANTMTETLNETKGKAKAFDEMKTILERNLLKSLTTYQPDSGYEFIRPIVSTIRDANMDCQWICELEYVNYLGVV